MKILIIHNRYQEAGGEDEVVNSEANLLRNAGHSVIYYERSNKEIAEYGLLKKINFLVHDIAWSKLIFNDIKNLAKREKPDLAHVHNTFILLTPSVYDALNEADIPIVQTLHNYRLFCANGLLFRDENICEDCFPDKKIPSLLHRCWRNSFLLTYFVNECRRYGGYLDKIDAFIALSEFSKDKFMKGGIPKERIFVKPNFVNLPEQGRNSGSGDGYAIFIGRLAPYKGIYTLISAYGGVKNLKLKVIGDGPLFTAIKQRIKNISNIELLGKQTHERTLEYLKNAKFLIFPSECYENMPRVIIESFACSVPVLASDMGAVKEMVRDGYNGILSKPKNPVDLADKILYLKDHPDVLKDMGINSKKEYQAKYTSARNYEILMQIYNETIRSHKRPGN